MEVEEAVETIELIVLTHPVLFTHGRVGNVASGLSTFFANSKIVPACHEKYTINCN